MRWLAVVGVVLVLLGSASLVFNAIPYHQTEQVAKIGPLVATQETEKQLVIPAYVGVIVILAGIALVFAGRRS